MQHVSKNASPLGRGTILLVEDREEDVFFLRRALSRVGADVDVRVVSNGAEAQAYMSGDAPFTDRKYYPLPNIIVCDFKMPRRGGVDFLQWLRRQKDFESLPFILLSGSVLPHEQQLALNLGADLYLRKTADFGKMIEYAQMILRFLERRGTADFRRPPDRHAPKDRTVLIIEDEASVRRMLADVLEAVGFGVTPVETSTEGLACARAQRPDVVLCDVVLPDAIGFETAKALNEQPATRDVPVILMTGYAYMRDVVPHSKWTLLLKPLSAHGITEAVMNALQATGRVA
jgi:two-component system, chemotaxis family, response regulator Rcp1